MTFHPDAYFTRIGFDGQRAATLTTLTALHSLHAQTIPFENLDPLLERPVSVEIDAVAAKLVQQRRGGYCFEHNCLFHGVLGGLGFNVTPLAARVVWHLPEAAPRPPLSHRLTLVELPEGRFIADVGFGGPGPPVPIRIDDPDDQATSHGRYRVFYADSHFQIELRVADRWQPMYRFGLARQEPRDFEVANWYTSTNPNSLFRRQLTVARIVGDERLHIRNRTFTVYETDGDQRETKIKAPAELYALLIDSFGIECPVPIEELWARIPVS